MKISTQRTQSGLYFSADDAISRSFEHLARSWVRSPAFLRDLRGSTVAAASGMGPLDWIAQAVYTLSIVSRALDRRQQLSMMAWYMPRDTRDDAVKLQDRVIQEYAGAILREFPRIPYWYGTDTVRRFIPSSRSHHTDEVWSEKLEVSLETLRRWRAGRGGKPGLTSVLEADRAGMLSRAEDALWEAGLLRG